LVLGCAPRIDGIRTGHGGISATQPRRSSGAWLQARNRGRLKRLLLPGGPIVVIAVAICYKIENTVGAASTDSSYFVSPDSSYLVRLALGSIAVNFGTFGIAFGITQDGLWTRLYGESRFYQFGPDLFLFDYRAGKYGNSVTARVRGGADGTHRLSTGDGRRGNNISSV
jgi:hypothetical protein